MEKVIIKSEVEEEDIHIKKIVEAVNSLDFYSMKLTIKQAIQAGISTVDIIRQGVLKGLEESGEMGLILAAEALDGELVSIDEDERKKLAESRNYSGKVVIGTIQGDIHNLGKSIIIAIMRSYGMDIIDLGVDIPPEKFKEAACKEDVKVVGISYLLSSAEPAIKRAMSLLKNGDLANKVKVILGGAAASAEMMEETNADAYAVDALQGAEIIDKWLRS
ncbi:MAG: B12-binding domain-containing protein [Promethearchaeota archaeon]